MQKAKELIKAMTLRMKRRGSAEVPLAHQARRIASKTQLISYSLFRFRQADSRKGVFRPDRIEFEAETGLVSPGEQGGPRSGADRGCHIPAGTPGSGSSQRIDVRRRNLLAAIAAKFAVAEVIDHDKHNIRLRCFPVCGVQARMRSEQEGSDKRDYQQKRAMHDDFTGSDA